MASSGKKREREALFSGCGLAAGVQKFSHPERGNAVIEKICSFSPSRAVTLKHSVLFKTNYIRYAIYALKTKCRFLYFVATVFHISLNNVEMSKQTTIGFSRGPLNYNKNMVKSYD